jgi:hypothetical protein
MLHVETWLAKEMRPIGKGARNSYQKIQKLWKP